MEWTPEGIQQDSTSPPTPHRGTEGIGISKHAKEILDSVSSMCPCIVMKDDGYWNIRHTRPIRVRAIMISSPK
jgi:hypothetical protein